MRRAEGCIISVVGCCDVSTRSKKQGFTHVAPMEALLGVVEELSRLEEHVAHVVAKHNQQAYSDQTVQKENSKAQVGKSQNKRAWIFNRATMSTRGEGVRQFFFFFSRYTVY